MVLAALVFLVASGAIFGAYYAATTLPAALERRRLDQRLRDVSTPVDKEPLGSDASILKRSNDGPLPGIDRLLEKSGVGTGLTRLIEQSGIKTTSSAVVVLSLVSGAVFAFVAQSFSRWFLVVPIAGLVGLAVPVGVLMQRRGARMRAFEEIFPEALDLLSRALRAGHAFQSAMGMVGEEVRSPVGPEFKKTFEQQNFGLPLRDSLHQLSERMPLLDVRFFVTAVLIQRETGGNLSEILDNLSHVVRERFKIRRQVRVHTAHGRFTGYVLMALPAFLALALSFINPEHMNRLFEERMGQMMIVASIIMQAVGFFWIRQVIKIEV
jgi:tight adherence protein B